MNNTKLEEHLDFSLPGDPDFETPDLQESALFHLIGADVVWGIEELSDGSITTTSERYTHFPFETPRKPVHHRISVRAGDKIIFRTGGGRKLPIGEYIVSTFGREYYAMKCLE